MVDLAPAPPGVDAGAWTAACESVREFCGWHIAPSVTEDITIDGPGGSTLFLPTLHLTAVGGIVNDGTLMPEPEWSESGMVRGCWTGRLRGITASITHGYEQCPQAILDVLAEMVAAGDRVGVAAVANHDHSVTYDVSVLDRRQRATLDRYRLAWVS